MNIIVDTNIIISALIKDSVTRKIIIQCNDNLFFPKIMIDEIKRHNNVILSKSGLSQDNLETILNTLLKYIKIIPSDEIKNFIPKARKIMEKIDPGDVIFIAAALYKNAAIWSDDKDFQEQKEVKIFTTSNMVKRVLR